MSTVATARTAAARDRLRERWFFSGMAVACCAPIFLGFAPTYFLKGWYDTPALTPLHHLHGALFTAWMLLLVFQTSLIAAHRPDLHRRTGVMGGVLAAAMLAAGTALAIAATRRSLATGNPPAEAALAFMFVPLGNLALFAVLVGAGWHYRRQRGTHKRLMLLSTVAMLAAGLDRMIFPIGVLGALELPLRQPVFVIMITLFVIPCVVFDLATRRRVHPATTLGGLLIVLENGFRMVIGGTAPWIAFARWLTQ